MPDLDEDNAEGPGMTDPPVSGRRLQPLHGHDDAERKHHLQLAGARKQFDSRLDGSNIGRRVGQGNSISSVASSNVLSTVSPRG